MLPQPVLRPTKTHEIPSIVSILRSTADWDEPFVSEEDLKTQHLVHLDWAKENFQNDGWLEPYHEAGFTLWRYDLG